MNNHGGVLKQRRIETMYDMAIVINDKLKDGEPASRLSKIFRTVRYATMASDLLFPSIIPAMSITILKVPHDEHSALTAIDKLSDIQLKFKNCFCVVLMNQTDPNQEMWTFLNAKMPSGSMRILYADESFSNILEVITGLVDEFKDREKMKKQSDYFDIQEKEMITPRQAKKVTKTVLEKLHVHEADQAILQEALPSIAMLMQATQEELQEKCPVENETIESIISFFSSRHDT